MTVVPWPSVSRATASFHAAICRRRGSFVKALGGGSRPAHLDDAEADHVSKTNQKGCRDIASKENLSIRRRQFAEPGRGPVLSVTLSGCAKALGSRRTDCYTIVAPEVHWKTATATDAAGRRHRGWEGERRVTSVSTH